MSDEPHEPHFLGSDTVYNHNPFIVEDISGRQNKIIDAIKSPTNCLILRGDKPTVHLIDTHNPQILNINNKELSELPDLPVSTQVLLARDNMIRSISSLDGNNVVRVVDISNNMVEHLRMPASPSLQAFFASSSALVSVFTPVALEKLEILNLSANKLQNLDLSPFPSLKVLNLAINSFTEFEIDSTTLRELSIQANALTKITVKAAPSLAVLDISNNFIQNIDFISSLPSLTTLLAKGNRLSDYWESYVVASAPKIQNINGITLTEGEKAIHKDRVARAKKTESVPFPHRLITSIRQSYQALQKVTVAQSKCHELVELWITRAEEKVQRRTLIEADTRSMKCHYFIDREGTLLIYGALLSDEPSKLQYNKIEIKYCPILSGGDVERNVIELARQNPTSLSLSNNMLNTAADILFLRFFESVSILNIEGNSVMKMSLFRPLASYLMPSLSVINGQAISPEESDAGKKYFEHLLRQTRGIEVNPL